MNRGWKFGVAVLVLTLSACKMDNPAFRETATSTGGSDSQAGSSSETDEGESQGSAGSEGTGTSMSTTSESATDGPTSDSTSGPTDSDSSTSDATDATDPTDATEDPTDPTDPGTDTEDPGGVCPDLVAPGFDMDFQLAEEVLQGMCDSSMTGFGRLQQVNTNTPFVQIVTCETQAECVEDSNSCEGAVFETGFTIPPGEASNVLPMLGLGKCVRFVVEFHKPIAQMCLGSSLVVREVAGESTEPLLFAGVSGQYKSPAAAGPDVTVTRNLKQQCSCVGPNCCVLNDLTSGQYAFEFGGTELTPVILDPGSSKNAQIGNDTAKIYNFASYFNGICAESPEFEWTVTRAL